MIDPRRQVPGFVSLAIAGVLLLSYDYSDRGARFETPAAEAKTDRAGVYDLAKARMLHRVIGHVRNQYVSPERVDVKAMAVAALRAVQSQVPEVMVEVRSDRKDVPSAVVVTVGATSRSFSLDRVGDLFEFQWKMMDVFDFLQRHLPPTADLEELEYTAVNGVLGTLDPHSVLVTPQMYREMQLGTQGRFGGLGIVISIRDGMLTVMSVMDDTPAARSGLRSGDQIAQIGEESTVNMRLDEAVNRLRGEPGTDVTIWVRRSGWPEAKAFTLVREEIRVRALDHEELGDGIGYVKLRSFQGNTFDDLEESLAKLEAKGSLKGLVLDLRENPGGLLDQAIQVSDRFLDDGTIVTTVRERGKEREERHATRQGTVSDVPMVVLINKGSASASEIVAGALKHNDRALVVGTTSFGKGSVQVIYQIDDAALKLTIAQYLTPGDISIQSVGIVPDIEIERLAATKDRIDLHPDELDIEGEAGLEAHLQSKKNVDVKPAVTLRVLDGDEAGPGDAPKPPGDDAFRPDHLVRLGKALLLSAPFPNRPRALVQAAGFLEKQRAEEDARLTARLAELGIDWSKDPAPSKRKLSASIEVRREGGKPGRPRAGESVEIVATVENLGSKPAHRIHGVLDGEVGAFTGTEHCFGRIDPGKSRSWTAKVELPKSLRPTGDRLTIDLYEDGRPLAEAAGLGGADVSIDALPEPRFAWTAQVLDPKGSGDGLVQRGEDVELVVRVVNVGEGDGDDVLVTVKNESGEAVFIAEGRHKVGALPAGKEATARFSLKVRESLKSQDVQLKLGVFDQGLRLFHEDDLALPVFPREFPRAESAAGAVRVPSGTVVARSGAHRDTSPVAEIAAGTVLRKDARAGEWVRVVLGGGGPGWVLASEVEDAKGSEPDPRPSGVEPLLQHEPPALDLDASLLSALVVDGPSIRLAGSARFAGGGSAPRYVYAFRNEDKVFFTAGDTARSPRDHLPFEAEVPLEVGRNVLTLLAREGEDDVTRQSVVIYRKGRADEVNR